MQDADREQRVLVHRVDVVHVVLHLRDDAAEIGNEAAEYPGFVHSAQCRFRILARGQDFEKKPVRLRILAQPLVDQPQGLAGGAQGTRVDVEFVLLRDMKQAEQRAPDPF